MHFHHPIPLKTTHIQNNHIKESYKTHICHGLVANMVKKMLLFMVGQTIFFFFLKKKFIKEGVQKGI